MEMGIDREKAIEIINADLDFILGFENRKPLSEEKISKELFKNII